MRKSAVFLSAILSVIFMSSTATAQLSWVGLSAAYVNLNDGGPGWYDCSSTFAPEDFDGYTFSNVLSLQIGGECQSWDTSGDDATLGWCIKDGVGTVLEEGVLRLPYKEPAGPNDKWQEIDDYDMVEVINPNILEAGTTYYLHVWFFVRDNEGGPSYVYDSNGGADYVATVVTDASLSPPLQQQVKVLVWGEPLEGPHPLKDYLTNLGYDADADTSYYTHRRWVLRRLQYDVVVIKPGWEDHIRSRWYGDLNDFVAYDGGAIIIQAPDVTGDVSVLDFYSSPDLSVNVTSTGGSASVTSVDGSLCLGAGMPTSQFPTVTAVSSVASDIGAGWDVVAQASGNVGALTAEYGRGRICYLPVDLETSYTGRDAFVRQLINCTARRQTDANTDIDFLVYNPSSTVCDEIDSQLQVLGYDSGSITTTTDIADLSTSNLQDYDLLYIGHTADMGIYQSMDADIRTWVKFDRGCLLIEDPYTPGYLTVFPMDEYGNYTVNIGSIQASPLACAVTDPTFSATYELTHDDIPASYSNITSVGPHWRVLAESVSNADASLLFSEYYSGNFCVVTGRLTDAITADGSAEFWRRLINKVAHPYKPLDDVLFAVADDEPTWLDSLLSAADHFPDTDFEYYESRTGATTPNNVTLGQHDVILTWSWDPYHDQSSIGNNLKTYVDDYGRGVVVMGRAFDDGTTREILGTLASNASYLPFNPIAETNVQYIDYLNAATMTHKFFFDKTLGELQTIEDYYRANVELTSGACDTISIWDNDPVALWADTTELYQYVGGLAYNSGYLYGCDQDIDLPTEKPRFLRITPTAVGGEPVVQGNVPSAIDQVPEGLAFGGGKYWYTCSGANELYELSALDGTYDNKWSLGFAPGDLAYDASGYLWIASPSEDLIYQYNTSGSQLGSFSVGGYMDAPTGVALQGNELFVGGHTGSPQYDYGTVFVIDLTDTSAPVDSFPATGYDATGLAFEGSTRLWAFYEYHDPPMDGYNKVCGYESMYSNDPPSAGYHFRHFASVNTSGGAGVANRVAALNVYPGDSASFLDDAADGGHFADVLENMIEMVNIHPKEKNLAVYLDNPQLNVKRSDMATYFIELKNITASTVQFYFYVNIRRPSGTDFNITAPGNPQFEIDAWDKRTGKLMLSVGSGIMQGDYRITAYTKESVASEWNEKCVVMTNVSGNVTFPSSKKDSGDGLRIHAPVDRTKDLIAGDSDQFRMEIIWD